MKPTLHLRHVWREVNDGNGDVKVLALQQWHAVEGWEHPDFIAQGGEWRDVEISHSAASDDPPPVNNY